jgi:hypothetical protein
MVTVEATQQLDVTMFGPGVTAKCRQCNADAVAHVTTEQGRTTACIEHVRRALQHFAKAHGIR